jgi:hypothetical protein
MSICPIRSCEWLPSFWLLVNQIKGLPLSNLSFTCLNKVSIATSNALCCELLECILDVAKLSIAGMDGISSTRCCDSKDVGSVRCHIMALAQLWAKILPCVHIEVSWNFYCVIFLKSLMWLHGSLYASIPILTINYIFFRKQIQCATSLV